MSVGDTTDLVLINLMDQVADRLQAGSAIEVEELVREHPEHADRIRQLLPAAQLLAGIAGPTSELEANHDVAAPAIVAGMLGDFRILREVGRGGMGVVYEAEQVSLGRRVALKVLPFAATMDPRHLQRFQNEARAAASLEHAHIVPVHGVGCERGIHYYAMKFIDGQTLAALIEQQRRQRDSEQATATVASGKQQVAEETVPVAAAPTERAPVDAAHFRRVAEWGVEAAQALEYAHAVGIVHRDIKPANLMVDALGKLWLTDFGLARLAGDKGLTMTGDVLGTLRYMSPEQALAKRVIVDHRTDIYSLGATLYELLTLEPVFSGSDRQELLRQIAFEEPQPARRRARSVPAELETIVLKALEKNPAHRYATAKEMAEDLERFVKGEPIRARPPGLTGRLIRWVRRRRALAAAYGLALVVLLVSAFGAETAWLWRRAEAAREQAETARDDAHSARGVAEQALQKEHEAQKRGIITSNLMRVHLAERAWLDHDVLRARGLLETCPPELRCWEWHYLNRLCNPELVTHRLDVELKPDAIAAAISSDGELLAAPFISPDNPRVPAGISVCDVATGKEKLTLKTHGTGFGRLAFSPDSKLLATARADVGPSPPFGEVRIWDLTTRQEATVFREHGSEVQAVGFSADGRTVASGSTDRTIKVWEAATGHVAFSLLGHTDSVWGIGFSPDGKLLASTSADNSLKVWDLATRQEVHSYRGVGSLLTFSPDSKHVASGTSAEGGARIWDLVTGQSLLLPGNAEKPLVSLAFSPDGRHVAGGSVDKMLRVWDTTRRDSTAFRGFLFCRAVTCVTYSPDGKWLAGAAIDKTVRVADAATGEELFCLKGHEKEVTCVAFSPDGRHLASASRDHRIKVWDTATAKETLDIKEANVGAVWWLAYSPDGRRLATASADNTVKVWDLLKAGEGFVLQGHSAAVTSVAFSPDGRHIATGSRDQTVRLWDVASHQEIRTLAGHQGLVASVAFRPDGKQLASGSYDKTIKLWDVATGKEIFTMRGNERGVRGVAFSPDGRRLASASRDKTVRVWDTTSGRQTLLLTGHADEALSVAFSPDGRHLASSGSDDFAVRVWDLDKTADPVVLQGHLDIVRAVGFSSDGRQVISFSRDKTVKLWDLTRSPEVRTFTGVAQNSWSTALSPDGKHVTVGAGLTDQTARLFDLGTGRETFKIMGAAAVAYSPDGKYLATGSFADTSVKQWDLATGREISAFAGHAGPVSCVAYSPDGKRLASGSMDKTIRLWDLATGQVIVTLFHGAYTTISLAFSPDGKLLASNSNQFVKLWDLQTGLELPNLQGHKAQVQAVAFSPDGKQLASASWDQSIKLFDVASGKEIHTLKGHFAMVRCLAFSPDGRRLVSGSRDGMVKLWDTTAGEEALTLKAYPEDVTFVGFSRDGWRLVSTTWSRLGKVWDATPLPEQRIAGPPSPGP
jgi:WD40 repeat protein/serine/threonine protein kinase